ncbi:MAG TPA: branched-chain amino acid ABC transporter permease [Gemmatimonadaceae bacterium]|nr:branched-chain amino acid ABC transporter permease [Gemmatimonadaceae bacterium]
MSVATQYYVITLLVLFGVNVVAAWSLNLQHGVAGVWNFGFVVFQAIGAYVTAALTLGPPERLGGFQEYVLAADLPWPLPLLGAALAGGVLALLIGLFALKPKGRDYQALVLLVVSAASLVFVVSQKELFNGSAGLAGVPKPYADELALDVTEYGWFYVLLTASVVALSYLVIRRLTSSPWARRLKAQRDNPDGAAAIGIDVGRERLIVFVVGGALAAVSGGVLVQFIGAYSPEGWEYSMTFLYFTAIIVGGLANNAGVVVGVLLVWTVLQESVRYLPEVAPPTITANLQGIAIGLIILGFLWWRPQGLLPERRVRLGEDGARRKVADGGRQGQGVAHEGAGVNAR